MDFNNNNNDEDFRICCPEQSHDENPIVDNSEHSLSREKIFFSKAIEKWIMNGRRMGLNPSPTCRNMILQYAQNFFSIDDEKVLYYSHTGGGRYQFYLFKHTNGIVYSICINDTEPIVIEEDVQEQSFIDTFCLNDFDI